MADAHAYPVSVRFEPRMCAQHVVDLTLGCSFACVYCPFSEISAELHGVHRPTAVDLSALNQMDVPPAVYLSPTSDAFAPQAAPLTHALLATWLPRGTHVGIATKGIVPERTLDLLADFLPQLEGIEVGVTSLDDERNRIVEPGCPPARERLAGIDRIVRRGIRAGLRIDPMFPDVDDDRDALATLVGEGARRGVLGVIGSYVFGWGRYLRRFGRIPLLARSCELLTEQSPLNGGFAMSVPLERKLGTYRYLDELSRAHGLKFGTCGCKDTRLTATDGIYPRCRLPAFLPASDPARSCRV